VGLLAQDADTLALQHFNAAHKAQDAGDLDTAAREYQEVIRLRPDAAEGYASLGLVYNAEGKFAASERALQTADKLKSGLPGVSLYLGINLVRERQAATAVPHLVEAVRLDPASKEAQTWLGRALWDEDKTQAALEQMRKTSLLFPTDSALLLNAGEAYHKAAELAVRRVLADAAGTPLQSQVFGDIYKDERTWESAMAHYYRALEQDPHWKGAHFGLAEVAFHREKFEAAAQEYRRELEVNPDSAAALARLAEIALLAGKPDEAVRGLSSAIHISAYETTNALGLPQPYPPTSEDLSDTAQSQLRSCMATLEAAPESPARSVALTLVNARLGNKNASQSAWDDFTKSMTRPRLSSAYARGLDEFARHEFEAASADLDAWLKLHPHDLQAAYLLARTYRNLSLRMLEQLLAVAPDSYPAHQLLAETYQNAEQNEKALAEYRVVETMAPEMAGVHFSIGHILLQKGQQEQAREEFAAELRINPDHPEANAELGTIFLNQMDPAKAMPYLEKAVQLNPDSWPTYRELGKAFYLQKDFAKAAAALQPAIHHDPDGLAHYQLGLVYRSMGHKQEADQQFEISRKLKLAGLAHDETKMNKLDSLPQ
jgi:tetratricopeptide (TPR) repeat protein